LETGSTFLDSAYLISALGGEERMSAISYLDVFEIQHDQIDPEEIGVGDTVRMGGNLAPHYAVVAISGDKAWVRNVHNGQDALAPLSRCRKVA
jgi:hypothetical protein